MLGSSSASRLSCRRVSVSPRAIVSKRTVKAASSVEDAYVCLGVSHCFEKNENGKLVDCFQIEPISASSLECMATGARTSFKAATGMTFGAAFKMDKSGWPGEFETARFCDSFKFRLDAAARTWSRPHAQDNLMDIVPLGKVKSGFNFSLDDKRILNFDNVDISIDVYGRKEKEAEEAKAAAAIEAKRQANIAEANTEEDDLEALLA
eukprot:gene21830-28857_t